MNKPFPIKATFIDEITYDLPSQNYSNEDWISDLDAMQEVGIDTVVFIRGYFVNKCVFPSKYFPTLREKGEDLADLIFRECEKRNMKVFMGTYMTDLTWNNGDIEPELEKNELFIKEVMDRYGKYKSFYGWYISHEVGGNNFNIKKLHKGLTDIFKKVSPDRKILISPFFQARPEVYPDYVLLSPERTYEVWDNILANSGRIDFCAFQDGTAPLDKRVEYFEAVQKACHKHGVELWANIELMGRGSVGFNSIDFLELRNNINMLEPIVDNYMTFEFSHFMSPNSVYKSANRLYKLYKDYYSKK